jgi:hypothetical protein
MLSRLFVGSLLSLALVTPALAKGGKPAPVEPAPAAAAPAAADPLAGIDPSMVADIRQLLEVTGQAQLGKQVLDQMFAQFRTTMPQVPAAAWDELQARLKPEQLVDMVIPIYARHLQQEDIRALIAFYQSPAGQRFVAAQPVILQESMAAGSVWGQEVAKEVAEDLTKKGLLQ